MTVRWMRWSMLLMAMVVCGSMQGSGQEPASKAAGGAAAQYDFYLFNLSWSPEFCVTHPTNPQCAARPGFIVHGLWPERTDGSYPSNCGYGPGPAAPESWADITPDASLIEHEWRTHGTCTGLTPDAFFGMERKAFREVAIPAILKGLDHEIMLPPEGILEAFAKANPGFPAGSVLLSCGNNRLTAIEVCMTKGLAPMACPAAIRSCRANAVKVTPQVVK